MRKHTGNFRKGASPEEIAAVEALRAEGLSMDAAAKRLNGVVRRRIVRAVYRGQSVSSEDRRPEHTLHKMAAMVSPGMYVDAGPAHGRILSVLRRKKGVFYILLTEHGAVPVKANDKTTIVPSPEDIATRARLIRSRWTPERWAKEERVRRERLQAAIELRADFRRGGEVHMRKLA